MDHDGSDLVIVVPLWRRTKHIERVAVSALRATPQAHVLFVASVGDRDVVDVLERLDYDYVLLSGEGGGKGDYAQKINAGYRASTAPFIFTGADDLDFHARWYAAAREPMPRTRSTIGGVTIDGPIGVVGTSDLCNARTMDGTHSTHSLVARWYADLGTVDEANAIYHTGYWHEFCDDEAVATAVFRDAYAHAFDAVVEHLHPNAGKSPDDETYRRGKSRSMLSRKHFHERLPLWDGHSRFQARQVYAKRAPKPQVVRRGAPA